MTGELPSSHLGCKTRAMFGARLAIFGVLAAVAAARWLPTHFNVPYFGNDTIYPLDPQMDGTWLFSMWDPAQLGQPSLFPALLPFLGLFALFHAIGLSLGASQHLYEWLVASIGALVVGQLSAESSPFADRKALVMLLGGVAYLLMPQAVYLPLGWWATVGIPLAIYGMKRAMESSTMWAAAAWGGLGALANLCLLNDVPNFQLQVVLVIWGVTAICAVLLAGFPRPTQMLSRLSAYAGTAIALLSPLTVAIAWPLISSVAASEAITHMMVGANGTFGDYGHTTIGSVLTLMSYYPEPWQNQLVRSLSTVAPLLSLIGIAGGRRNPWIIGVAAATVASILMTVGPNPPVAPVYRWIMVHAPGSLAFRTVGKIHLFIAVGYAILAPAGLVYTADMLGKVLQGVRSRWVPTRRGVTLAAAFIFIGILGIVGKPVWMGQAFRTPVAAVSQPRVIPTFYARVGSYLKAHRGRTLVYPPQGYTQEMLPNGWYFGPSLVSMAFPRDIVFSPLGAYGAPASPAVRSLYQEIAHTLKAPRLNLLSPRNPREATVNTGASGKTYLHNGAFRWVPESSSVHSSRLTVNFSGSQRIQSGASLLFLRLGATGIHDIRFWLNGRYLGTERNPDSTDELALGIPKGTMTGGVTTLSLSFKVVPRHVSAGDLSNLSLRAVSIVPAIPAPLYDALLARGIQYIFLDGASADPEASKFARLTIGDPRLHTEFRDAYGRQLLRISGYASDAYLRSTNGWAALPEPSYGYGQLTDVFLVRTPGQLVIEQNCSSLWRYWLSFNDGPFEAARRQRCEESGDTVIDIPTAGRYRIRGLFLPQLLLDLQYVVFAGAFAALVVLSVRATFPRKNRS